MEVVHFLKQLLDMFVEFAIGNCLDEFLVDLLGLVLFLFGYNDVPYFILSFFYHIVIKVLDLLG